MTDEKQLGFFQLKVYIGHPFTLDVQAGETASQAEAPAKWFTITAAKRAALMADILAKLAEALKSDCIGIPINIDINTREIVSVSVSPCEKEKGSHKKTHVKKEAE